MIILLITMSLMGQNFTSHATIDHEFCGNSVIVIMNESVGSLNKVHDPGGFEGVEILEIRDLFRISDEALARTDIENFRQILLLRLPADDKQNVLNVIEQLRFINGVEFAEPNYILQRTAVPNDPYYVNNFMWGLEKIQAEGAWGHSIGYHGVKVGIIDTGIAYHEDLQDNWVNGYDFINDRVITRYDSIDEWGHGTHVAGTVGAVGNNGIGVVGINWNVSLVPLRISAEWTTYVADAVLAIEYAHLNLIPILNFSFAGYGYATSVMNAVRNYYGLFVWSAGNWDQDLPPNIQNNTDLYPLIQGFMDTENLIAVGSSDFHDERAFHSKYGYRSIDIYAPGEGIYST
jgi:subtilisin family serine protease